MYIYNLALFKYMCMLLVNQGHNLAMQILVTNALVQENNVIKLIHALFLKAENNCSIYLFTGLFVFM